MREDHEVGVIVWSDDEARAFTWRDSGSMEEFEEVDDFEAGVPTVRRTSPLNKWAFVSSGEIDEPIVLERDAFTCRDATNMEEFSSAVAPSQSETSPPPSWSEYQRERALSDMEEVDVELALHQDDAERMDELVDVPPTPTRPASWKEYQRWKDYPDMDEVEVALAQRDDDAERMNEFVHAPPPPPLRSWKSYVRERDHADMDEVEVTRTQQEEESERMSAFDDEVLAPPPPLRSWKSYVRERDLADMDEVEATEDRARMEEAPVAGAATWAEYVREQELDEMAEIDTVEDKTRMRTFDEEVLSQAPRSPPPRSWSAYTAARDEVEMSEIDVSRAAEEQRRNAQLRALGGEINSFYTWLTGAEAGRASV